MTANGAAHACGVHQDADGAGRAAERRLGLQRQLAALGGAQRLGHLRSGGKDPWCLAASVASSTVRTGEVRTWGVALITAPSAGLSVSCSCRHHIPMTREHQVPAVPEQNVVWRTMR